MQPNDLMRSVLNVLAITIIIDQKVVDPEMHEFRRQVAGIADIFFPELTPDIAQKWFEDNQADIRAKMISRGRNTVILKALTRIEDPILRENLYDSIIAISVADKEYHKQESDLVRSAASIWGYMRPPFAVVDN